MEEKETYAKSTTMGLYMGIGFISIGIIVVIALIIFLNGDSRREFDEIMLYSLIFIWGFGLVNLAYGLFRKNDGVYFVDDMVILIHMRKETCILISSITEISYEEGTELVPQGARFFSIETVRHPVIVTEDNRYKVKISHGTRPLKRLDVALNEWMNKN